MHLNKDIYKAIDINVHEEGSFNDIVNEVSVLLGSDFRFSEKIVSDILKVMYSKNTIGSYKIDNGKIFDFDFISDFFDGNNCFFYKK